MKKLFWSSEKLLGISALGVSLCTLMVFMYQTNLIREQQYMSVYPHLSIMNLRSGSLNYEYVLKNDGVGPALIQSVKVRESNGKIYTSLKEYLSQKIGPRDSIWSHHTDIGKGKLIPADEQVVLFGLFDEAETAAQGRSKNTIAGAKRLRQALNADGLEVEIRYRSIYGETWSVSNGSSIPKKH